MQLSIELTKEFLLRHGEMNNERLKFTRMKLYGFVFLKSIVLFSGLVISVDTKKENHYQSVALLRSRFEKKKSTPVLLILPPLSGTSR